MLKKIATSLIAALLMGNATSIRPAYAGTSGFAEVWWGITQPGTLSNIPPNINKVQGAKFYTDLPIQLTDGNDTQVHTVVEFWLNRKVTGWGHGSNQLPGKPIYVGAKQCQIEYSDLTHADGATTAQMLYLLGAPISSVNAAATAAGFKPADIYSYATAVTNAQDIFKGVPVALDHQNNCLVARDKIVLPATTIDANRNSWGVILDAEMADDRTPDQLRNFLIGSDGSGGLLNIVHFYKKRVVICPDSLVGAGVAHCGFDISNLNAIAFSSDRFMIPADSTEAATKGGITKLLYDQVNLITGSQIPAGSRMINQNKFLVSLGVKATTPEDATKVNQYIHTYHWDGAQLIKAGASSWSDPTIQTVLQNLLGESQ